MKRFLALGLFVSVFFLSCAPEDLQETIFTVTVDTRTINHPIPAGTPGVNASAYFVVSQEGEEDPVGPVEAPTLELTVGQTYLFKISTPATHPFYITDSNLGQGAGTTIAGGNSFHSDQSFLFTPTAQMVTDFGNTLYYQCFNHQQMGWRILLVNP